MRSDESSRTTSSFFFQPTSNSLKTTTVNTMSVGVGLGQGHVTLGHGGSTNDPTSPSSTSSTAWSVQCWDTLDQVDHLILLPERALKMDSGWLQADLAEILAQSVVNGAVPLLRNSSSRSSYHDDDDRRRSTNRRRRSFDWSLVNPTGGHSGPQSLVAVTSKSSKFFPNRLTFQQFTRKTERKKEKLAAGANSRG